MAITMLAGDLVIINAAALLLSGGGQTPSQAAPVARAGAALVGAVPAWADRPAGD